MRLRETILALMIPALLGYLFISGRYFIIGSVEQTGYDYINLGFDFHDYVFQGFLANFRASSFLALILAPPLILILRQFFYSKELFDKINIIFSYLIVLFIHKYIKRNKNIDKKELFKEEENKYFQKKEKAEKNPLSKTLLTSYYLSIFLYLFLLVSLVKILDFYKQGKESAQANILGSITYIKDDESQLFRVICGKEVCIYANKNFDSFKKIKEDNYPDKDLQQINNLEKNSPFFFFLLSEKQLSPIEKVVYVQIHSKEINLHSKNPYFFRAYTRKVRPYLSNLKFEKRCYKDIENDEIKGLNQKASQNKEKPPYFVAFKIPVEQSIDHIDIFDPKKNIQQYNFCKQLY
ncbi:hypothetical protein Q5M49_02235 [Acinetobacter nosocomialis]|uniref:hypothetical protein n=1 Tax=Acinetobacter nosocomialis TaxID=106654 RepID=UPI0026F566A5|nr:hypothetical protein [Acinetobacter nosocomialis]MDO7192506.1 hypothetical protein [Acinetobacter nosocomialis]